MNKTVLDLPLEPDLPLEREQVKQYLPHRAPMLFIDRVTALSGHTLSAEAYIDPQAEYFKGHFPNFPIQPGVLIVEMAAQAGALLVALTDTIPEGKFMAFSGIDKAKFKQPAFPGETLTVDVEILQRRLPFYKFAAKVTASSKLVANVHFSAAAIAFDKA